MLKSYRWGGGPKDFGPFGPFWGWNWVGLGWDWVWGDLGLRGWGLGLDNFIFLQKTCHVSTLFSSGLCLLKLQLFTTYFMTCFIVHGIKPNGRNFASIIKQTVSSNTAMEGVRTFLESSTVHGLSYISTTRRYVRIFWILVVIAGFGGASFLIKKSFDAWSESPVKTHIDSLPISKITLPKVTVCPPRNTFTDLNYDLMLTENMTLTQEMRHEMFKFALEVINADNFSKLIQEDRFSDWYHGFTKIVQTHIQFSKMYSWIDTAATSGVLSTQYYGQQFKSERVEKKLRYKVNVYPPESVKQNKNVTLHFSLEKVSMTGLLGSSKDTVRINGLGDLDADQTFAYTNFTPPGDRKYVELTRDLTSEDVEQSKLDVMPGLRFSWWYTGAELTPEPERKYKDDDMTKHFVR